MQRPLVEHAGVVAADAGEGALGKGAAVATGPSASASARGAQQADYLADAGGVQVDPRAATGPTHAGEGGELGAASGLYLLSQSDPQRREASEGVPAASEPSDDGLASDHEYTSGTKRKSFLERNRQAAHKCRQRKKVWLASLQSRIEHLQGDNKALQHTVESLRAEVFFLKTQLLQPPALEPRPLEAKPKEPHDTSRPMAAVPLPSGFVAYPLGSAAPPAFVPALPASMLAYPPTYTRGVE